MQTRFRKTMALAKCFRLSWTILVVLLSVGVFLIAESINAREVHSLSVQERDWLAAHPVITLAPDPDYPPIEYFDENREYCGIAADYVALLEKKLGFRFKIAHVQSWDEILNEAKSRQIDMFGAAAETPQRSEYMLFTRPFVEFPSVIIVRKNVSESLSLEKLNGMKVAMVSGYADHDFIKNNYPNLQMDEVPTVAAGLRKVSFGMVDALITNLAAATYYIEKEGITNLRLAGNTGYTYRLGFGVRKDWPELIDILENGLAQIEPSVKEAIFKKWVHLEEESLLANRGFRIIVLSGLIITFLIVLGLFVWNRSLKSVVNLRTQELSDELGERKRAEDALQKAHDELERRVEERTAELTKLSDALRNTNEYLDNLMKYAHAPIIVWDAGYRITRFNRAFERLTGRDAGEVLGQELDFLFPESSRKESLDYIRSTTGKHWETVEIEISHRDATVRILLWNSATLYAADGKTVMATIAQGQDITERKRAEEALQDSEKRYRRLFESAKDGILILDAYTGKVVDVNPFLIELLGYTYDELCGKHIWEIGAFKDVAASKDAFNVLQNNEYIRYDDLPLETNEGQPIAVEFVSNVYMVDHSKVIQCNIRDITAYKRARAERKRLMAAIDQAGEAIVMTDAQGNIQFVNPAFERTTGYTREEAVGQNLRILKSGEQDDLFYRNLWKTISGGKTWAGHMVNKRKDGTLYTEEATIAPVRDASGLIVNYVAVQRDITDHLRLTAQFQQAQKMEAVGRLAGGVAHDFNNMLGIILGHAEMAMDHVDPAQPLFADLQEIRKAAERSANLTRQLLAFARKQTIAPKVLDLNETVESMLKMLRRLIGEDIDLAWFPARNLWPVKIDPSQVDQILANLCVNARDAIAGVGKVTIETEDIAFDEAYCADHAGFVPGEYVLLAVSDDGSGMDKETQDRLFEPFFTTKGVGKGTGLGLATVYGIVKQNNGFINVYSEPGQGTTFKIYIPRHAGQAAEDLKARTVKIPKGRGETVLLVEDELAILNMTTMMLERLGYTALAASTPSEAMRLAEEHTGEIHLLITDVVMPEINGRDLAHNLLSLYPNIKPLFMSGYTADVIAHHGVLDPGVNFIQKPFSKQELAAKVREALEE